MLTLEVSEQTGTAVASASFFAQLAELGVRVALDDFGTGFASLESLGGWPVDELKLDMSLVRPIASQLQLPDDRPDHHRPRPSARRQGRGRRGRVRGRPVRTAGPRLRLAPGLSARAADGRRRLRRLAARAGTALAALGSRPGPAGAGSAAADGAPGRGPRLPAGDWGAPPAASWTRSGGATLAAAVAMLVVYGLWQVFRWGGHRHQALIGDLAFFPVNGAAAVCAWRVSRRTGSRPSHVPGVAPALRRALALPAR